ncbi:TetR/AcrR family transcriptional regulator [Amycolatopsis keratiniphila]|uniref:TetR/AcrR family transcriptional regulator n=1 Tax=Amycolatopsis keratiniphila TaxID=129921 RepID=UPI00087AF6DC|nr:TetR/AcrR family transcriptional regulator [Amycolatopsis keratiniphila]OLZ42923.1 TetR family transcriptional regulator [Amycolatopsis keratiniphila subsp. nogabecina]SDU66263.1 DNA-binding transcriptional regulator, AcrR family [Amycolatopsis keratiniphila]
MSTATPTPSTPEEDPRLARSRARLLDAATHLLAEGGVDAVTIDAVTRTAGIARATLYRHFGTGTELLAAAFERLLPPVAPAPAHGPLRQRLLTLLTNQAHLIDHAPLQLTVLSWLGMAIAPTPPTPTHSDRPRLHTLRRRIIEQYSEPFDAVLTSDTARNTFHPGTDTTTALAQLIGPLVFNRLVTGTPNDEKFCTQLVDDFLTSRTGQLHGDDR